MLNVLWTALDWLLYILNPDYQFTNFLERWNSNLSFSGFYLILVLHHGAWLFAKFGVIRGVVLFVRSRKRRRQAQASPAGSGQDPNSVQTNHAPRSRKFLVSLKRLTRGKRVTYPGLAIIGLEPWCQKIGIFLVALKWEQYGLGGLLALWIGGSCLLVLNTIAAKLYGKDSQWIMYGFMLLIGVIILVRWLKKNGRQT